MRGVHCRVAALSVQKLLIWIMVLAVVAVVIYGIVTGGFNVLYKQVGEKMGWVQETMVGGSSHREIKPQAVSIKEDSGKIKGTLLVNDGDGRCKVEFEGKKGGYAKNFGGKAEYFEFWTQNYRWVKDGVLTDDKIKEKGIAHALDLKTKNKNVKFDGNPFIGNTKNPKTYYVKGIGGEELALFVGTRGFIKEDRTRCDDKKTGEGWGIMTSLGYFAFGEYNALYKLDTAKDPKCWNKLDNDWRHWHIYLDKKYYTGSDKKVWEDAIWFAKNKDKIEALFDKKCV